MTRGLFSVRNTRSWLISLRAVPREQGRAIDAPPTLQKVKHQIIVYRVYIIRDTQMRWATSSRQNSWDPKRGGSSAAAAAEVHVAYDTMTQAVNLLRRNALFQSRCLQLRAQTRRQSLSKCPGRAARVRRFSSIQKSDGTLIGTLREMVQLSVRDKFPDYAEPVDVAECANPSLGDYQCSSAMQIFSVLKRAGYTNFHSPRDVADCIISGICRSPTFDSITIAGPGFINFKLSEQFINSQLQQARLEKATDGSLGKVLVDFSSPNIAKEMHVGHLRSTIIGDVLCNVFEHCGYATARVNHVGDWGTQFGMLIQFMNDHEISSDSSVSDLQQFYKQAKERFDHDELFKARSKEAVIKLQSYEPSALGKWRQICEASRKEFQIIYDRLNIRIDEKGESFYNDMIPDVLDELLSKGIIVENAGALCIFDDDPTEEAPVICRKSDGGFNYASTDLAALRYRIREEGADRIIYVTDQGQYKHFKAIFKTASAAGWGNSSFEHVGFGVVLGDDGKRLRTRSGDTVKLKELLDEAEERCLQFLQTRGTELSPPEIREAAKVLGVSAVKYADLHNNRLTAYTFSFDRMLDLKGNTAMYLQYSHARVATILRRASVGQPVGLVRFEHEAERLLAIQLIKWNDVLELTMKDLMPSRICDYLYTLCTTFNNFYTECKVIGGENEASRVLLCSRTATTIQLAFSLLGMQPLARL